MKKWVKSSDALVIHAAFEQVQPLPGKAKVARKPRAKKAR